MRHRHGISFEPDTHPVETLAANLTRGKSARLRYGAAVRRLSAIRKPGSSDLVVGDASKTRRLGL
jgi:hypothetical protein